MGVIENAFLKVKDAADVAGKKTNEIVDISRLKINIASLEKKIDSEYCELGKMVYKASKEKSDCTDYVTEKVTAIDAVIEERKQLVEKLNKSQNVKVCSNCGAKNAQDDSFCSKCGSKL